MWHKVRDRWLADATRTLDDDDRVVGAWLVGSFGRGEADGWSDVDLFVVVRDDALEGWTAGNAVWDDAELVIPAWQNTRATARSVGTVHVVDGLPVGADWYAARASEVDTMPPDDFDRWNALGDRGTPHPFTDDERRAAHAVMSMIAGKRIARRLDPPQGLDGLEAQVRRDAPPTLRAPLLAYLAEVRRAIE